VEIIATKFSTIINFIIWNKGLETQFIVCRATGSILIPCDGGAVCEAYSIRSDPEKHLVNSLKKKESQENER
jgi:hypothetical protein